MHFSIILVYSLFNFLNLVHSHFFPSFNSSSRNSSSKNKNSVINYSPSCRSKPIRPSFIFWTQIKIFLIKSESFLTLHRQQRNYHVQGPERYCSKVIVNIVHVTYSGSTIILWSYENTFLCAKKTKKQLYSTVLLFLVSLQRVFTRVPW